MTRTSALRAHLLDELEIDAVVQLAKLPSAFVMSIFMPLRQS
jgi:hypothetical protein